MDNYTALKLIREDYDGSDYTAVEEWVDDGHVEHDTTSYYSIFLRKADMTYWIIRFHSSYKCGLDEYSVYAQEAEKKERVITEWVGKN